MRTYSFTKAERLCSSVHINNLFIKGNRVLTQFPFRVLWQQVHEPQWPYPAQVLITVSKRNFKSSVDRNRIKRQLRELYRLRKHTLYQALSEANQQVIISINYIGKSKMKHQELEPIFNKLLNKWVQQIHHVGKE